MKISTLSKFLYLLFGILITSFSGAFANITVTQAPLGLNISNDLSSTGPAAGYFSIGNIVFEDNVAGDFIPGTNRTLTFAAPAGWRYLVGSGSVTVAGTNLSAASIVVSVAAITVTYTVTGTNGTDNALTISGIAVQSTTNTLGTAVNIVKTAGVEGMAGFNNGSVIATLSKQAGTFKKLLVLLPGETAVPGSTTTTGKTGVIPAQTSVSPVDVVVNAVDYAFNLVTTVSDFVAISSPNPHFLDTPIANQQLLAGKTTFQVVFRTAQISTNVTVTDVHNGTITPVLSSSVRVNVGAYTKLLIVLPGETFDAGSATGKSGARSNWISNSATTFTVYAVDNNFNRVTAAPANSIAINSDDPQKVNPANASLSSGARTFTTTRLITLASIYKITAADVTAGISYTTAAINVVPGAYTKLQILLPGEANAPNTTSGKTGTPFSTAPFNGTPPVAGTAFEVTVNAVDANWNLVNTVTNNIEITNVDAAYAPSSELPAITALFGGTKKLNVILKRAVTNHQLRASDKTDLPKTFNRSTTFTIIAGTYVKLQMIVPGETASPGTMSGKTGSPSNTFAGTPFRVTVNAVDQYWNRTITNDNVQVTTTDPNGTNSTIQPLVSGYRTSYSVTLRTIGTASLTATNKTNVAIIANSNNAVPVVSGGFVKLQILLPGETAVPGTATGKTNTPNPQVAGVPFLVTVNAVDAAWNVISGITDEIKLTSTDLNATLPVNESLVNGTKVFQVTLVTSGARTITANDVSNGAKTLNTSSSVAVGAGAYVGIIALMPGQTIAPGTATGIIGNPTIPARGNPFDIRIRAVDIYFNPVNGITNGISFLTSDAAGLMPAATTLVTNTYRTSQFRINTAGGQTITITDATASKSVVVNVPDPTPASANTDYFRSTVSGVWADAATWESSTDGSTNWHAATLVPNATANNIVIRSPHVVEVLASVSVDQLTIASGAELMVTLGTLTVVRGLAAIDLQVNGTLTGNNAGVITSTTGLTSFASGSKYQHQYTTISGTIPLATWSDGSTCEISGYTSLVGAITNGNQNFANLVWNCPNQNIATDGPGLGANFNAKNLTISSTGSGMMFLGSAVGTSTISGNFTLSDGIVAVTRSGIKTVNITGNVMLLDGNLLKGISTGTANINFAGTTVQQYKNVSTIISGAINFAVNSNAIVDFGTSVIDGTSGTFSLGTGATLITANADGIAAAGTNLGTIQNTDSRTYPTTANYTYNGVVEQVVGSGLPTAVNNLTINNAQGVVLPPGLTTYTINGALAITGFLDMGEHPLAGNFTNSGSGRFKTAATNPFAAGNTWNVGVEYTSNALQNIIVGNYKGLFATSGDGVKIAPSSSLNILGNWSSAGGKVDFESNPTAVANFNGLSAQSLVDLGSDAGAGLEFINVNFGNSGVKTLTSGNFSLASVGMLTMASPATLHANGNLTLRSTETSSATVTNIPPGAAIAGSVKVERFVKGGTQSPYRTYRMLSSPIYSSLDPAVRTYSFAEFKDDMIVTGTGGNTNGFDANAANSASAWTHNGSFVAIPNINTTVKVGRGAYLFYRGDRSNIPSKITPPFTNPENLTMDFDGVLNQQAVNVTLNAGYNLVGNPYAASIDWNSANLIKPASLSNTIRIWNPADREYATYDGTIGTNGGSNIVPMGQGFFIYGDVGSILTFNETAKVTAQAIPLLMSAPAGNKLTLEGSMAVSHEQNTYTVTPAAELRLTLIKGGSPYQSETVVVLQEGKNSSYTNGEDTKHITVSGSAGTQVFFSSRSTDNENLVINYMPKVGETAEVDFNLDNRNAAGNYTLSIDYKNVPSGYFVKLNDKFLGSSYLIGNNSSYDFNIDKSQLASEGPDRFSVSFEGAVTLPIILSSFTATKTNGGVAVKWNAITELNHKRYVLERAGEDKVYQKIYTVDAKGSGSSYTHLDKLPLLGNNYYRLLQVDNDGKQTVSSPIVVNYTSGVNKPLLTLYPNPVREKFTVQYSGVLQASSQILKVVNNMGQVLLTKAISKVELTNGCEINMSSFSSGMYIVEIYDNGAQKIGQTKLIKE